MWIAQLPKPQMIKHQARIRKLRVYMLRVSAGLAMCVFSACSAPIFPNNTPTKAEVPFLGDQLTQAEIKIWTAQITQQSQDHTQQWSKAKRACYQRFFINACLHNALATYRAQSAILNKQKIELNHQRRALQEIDRQLRLQKNQKKLQ